MNDALLNAPNMHYKQDIELRLELISIIRKLNTHILNQSNSYFLHLTTGEPEASTHYDKYVQASEAYNTEIKNYSETGNKIDLLWGQNWFATVETQSD